MRPTRSLLSAAVLSSAVLIPASSMGASNFLTFCFPGPPLPQTAGLPASICSDPAYASCCDQTNGWWTLKCVEKAAAGYSTDICARNSWTQTQLPGTAEVFPRDFNLVALSGNVQGIADVEDPVAANRSVVANNFSISTLAREPVAAVATNIILCNGTVNGNADYSAVYTPTCNGGTTTYSPATDKASLMTTLPIDFNSTFNNLLELSFAIAAANMSTVTKSGNTLTFTGNQKQTEVNVFTVDAAQLAGVTSYVFSVSQNSSVIVNILPDANTPPTKGFKTITISNASVTGVNANNLLWNVEWTQSQVPITISGMSFRGSINAITSIVTLNNSQLAGTIVADTVVLANAEPHSAPYHIPATPLTLAKQQIQHVVVIMQENRSFDSYFGAYVPPAGQTINGYTAAMLNGSVTYTCTNPTQGTGPQGTYKLFHTTNTVEHDFPHYHPSAVGDISGVAAGGTLPINAAGNGTGFIDTACKGNDHPYNNPTDLQQVVGYHTDAEIPNYWRYAKSFVLQDNLFEAVSSWSPVSHNYIVSGWNADCTSGTCVSEVNNTHLVGGATKAAGGRYPWNNIVDVLRGSVTWKFYQGENWTHSCTACASNPKSCITGNDAIASFWNPLTDFTSVVNHGEDTPAELTNFYDDITNNTLPQVSWIVPGEAVSEHADLGLKNDIRWGQAYVTSIINAIMSNPNLWSTTAIFLSWDDWGGFYDHVSPPVLANDDNMGYGLRVPGLVISPWVKQAGLVDHQQLSHDAYLKFVEDLFAGGQRISNSDGRPDQRENALGQSDLLNDFDFTRTPLPPVTGLPCFVTP